jgi:uncharacterized protein (DUF58 family)
MAEQSKFLDPRVLNRVARLNLRARTVMEGFVSGLHKSPYHGFSVEFAQHREYTPGDDLRFLDWKVYGRSDRLYIKQYEQETNLRAYVLLDASESMDYRSENQSKFDYAATLAASISYLTMEQQDSAGLVLFDRMVTKFVHAQCSPLHLKVLVTEMEATKATEKTDLGHVLHDVAERIKNRSLVILISDLMDQVESIVSGLQHFRHKKHDVIVIHVLDEYEARFPFDRMTRFDGLEGYPYLIVDPRALREAYLEEVQKFTTEIRRGCLAQRIDYVQVTTDQPPEVALSGYLARRLSRTRAK